MLFIVNKAGFVHFPSAGRQRWVFSTHHSISCPWKSWEVGVLITAIWQRRRPTIREVEPLLPSHLARISQLVRRKTGIRVCLIPNPALKHLLYMTVQIMFKTPVIGLIIPPTVSFHCLTDLLTDMWIERFKWSPNQPPSASVLD